MLESGQQPYVLPREIGSPAIHRIVDLPLQILEVLTCQLRDLFPRIAPGVRAVTGRARVAVNLCALRHQLARAYAKDVLRLSLQLTDIGGDIRERLGIGQVMRISKVLHARIPALVVPVVDELAHDDREVLPGDARYSAIRYPCPGRAVTGHTGPKQLCTPIEIGLAMKGVLILLPGGGGSIGIGGQHEAEAQRGNR